MARAYGRIRQPEGGTAWPSGAGDDGTLLRGQAVAEVPRCARTLPLGLAASIVINILMPTSIHLPKPLLEAVDRKARALRISRNQLVLRALEREVGEGSDWSPGFFERLAERDPQTDRAVDELVEAVTMARRSKVAKDL
jgi:hypothetical protein